MILTDKKDIARWDKYPDIFSALNEHLSLLAQEAEETLSIRPDSVRVMNRHLMSIATENYPFGLVSSIVNKLKSTLASFIEKIESMHMYKEGFNLLKARIELDMLSGLQGYDKYLSEYVSLDEALSIFEGFSETSAAHSNKEEFNACVLKAYLRGKEFPEFLENLKAINKIMLFDKLYSQDLCEYFSQDFGDSDEFVLNVLKVLTIDDAFNLNKEKSSLLSVIDKVIDYEKLPSQIIRTIERESPDSQIRVRMLMKIADSTYKVAGLIHGYLRAEYFDKGIQVPLERKWLSYTAMRTMCLFDRESYALSAALTFDDEEDFFQARDYGKAFIEIAYDDWNIAPLDSDRDKPFLERVKDSINSYIDHGLKSGFFDQNRKDVNIYHRDAFINMISVLGRYFKYIGKHDVIVEAAHDRYLYAVEKGIAPLFLKESFICLFKAIGGEYSQLALPELKKTQLSGDLSL